MKKELTNASIITLYNILHDLAHRMDFNPGASVFWALTVNVKELENAIGKIQSAVAELDRRYAEEIESEEARKGFLYLRANGGDGTSYKDDDGWIHSITETDQNVIRVQLDKISKEFKALDNETINIDIKMISQKEAEKTMKANEKVLSSAEMSALLTMTDWQ